MSDYYEFLKEQSSFCKNRDMSNINFDRISETLRLLAESDLKSAKNQTSNLMAHLLKAIYQPEKSSTSWLRTIVRELDEVPEYFKESPSLKNKINDSWEDCYRRARTIASRETGLSLSAFPSDCPWTLDSLFYVNGEIDDIVDCLRMNIDTYEKRINL